MSISVQRKHFPRWGLLCFSFLSRSGNRPLNMFPRFGSFLFSSRPLPPGLCTVLADLGLRCQGVVLNAVAIDDIWQGWRGGAVFGKVGATKVMQHLSVGLFSTI